MKTLLTVIIASIGIIGCAASSIENLKERSALRGSFELSENYQAVYRKTKNEFTRCLQGQFATTDGDVYTDIPKAEIYQIGGGRYYTLIEMIGLDGKTTRVDYWILESANKRYASAYSAFFLENTPMCRK